MIAAPPLDAGAAHVSVALVDPGVARNDCGAVGTVRGMALVTLLGAPVPTAFLANTRK